MYFFFFQETSIFSSPEVDRLTKEIDELVKEKLSLEANITQREADIKIKAGEIKSLQVILFIKQVIYVSLKT